MLATLYTWACLFPSVALQGLTSSADCKLVTYLRGGHGSALDENIGVSGPTVEFLKSHMLFGFSMTGIQPFRAIIHMNKPLHWAPSQSLEDKYSVAGVSFWRTTHASAGI